MDTTRGRNTFKPSRLDLDSFGKNMSGIKWNHTSQPVDEEFHRLKAGQSKIRINVNRQSPKLSGSMEFTSEKMGGCRGKRSFPIWV